MRKITLLFLVALGALTLNAQTNLLTNPGFEDWADGKPTGWAVPANTSQASAVTIVNETAIKSEGASAMKLTIDDSANPGYQQIVPISPNKTYTVSIDYYVVSGDGTDARIWSSFKNAVGFYKTTDWAAATAKDASIQIKLQGDGTNLNNYFKIDNGVWGTYTTDFVSPEDATDFVFECRTYKKATVIWDNAVLKEKNTSGLDNNTVNGVKFHVSDGSLVAKNLNVGTQVEIYNTVGAKVLTTTYNGNAIALNKFSKGIYIVRAGKHTQKVLF